MFLRGLMREETSKQNARCTTYLNIILSLLVGFKHTQEVFVTEDSEITKHSVSCLLSPSSVKERDRISPARGWVEQ